MNERLWACAGLVLIFICKKFPDGFAIEDNASNDFY